MKETENKMIKIRRRFVKIIPLLSEILSKQRTDDSEKLLAFFMIEYFVFTKEIDKILMKVLNGSIKDLQEFKTKTLGDLNVR